MFLHFGLGEANRLALYCLPWRCAYYHCNPVSVLSFVPFQCGVCKRVDLLEDSRSLRWPGNTNTVRRQAWAKWHRHVYASAACLTCVIKRPAVTDLQSSLDRFSSKSNNTLVQLSAATKRYFSTVKAQWGKQYFCTASLLRHVSLWAAPSLKLVIRVTG